MTRKEQIVQTCMDIFLERGAKGLTMKAIADRVDISEPAIYRHFQNKEAVVVAMIEHVRKEMISYVEEVAHENLTTVEMLSKIYAHHLSYIKEKKGITVALLSESFFYQQKEARRHMLLFLKDYLGRIREIIALGIKNREIEKTVNPYASAVLFLGALQHLVTIFRLTGEEREVNLISEEVFKHYIRILTEGMQK